MEYRDTADCLLQTIKQDKQTAIKKGIIREEKAYEPITQSEIPYELPEGWIWIRLGDYALKVTDYVASGSFASLKENVLITNSPNYAIMVKTADFANGFTKNLTYTDRHGYEFLSNSNLFGGELILSNIGSIGKVFIVPYLDYPMTLASNTVMVKLSSDELIKYIYYYFLSPLGQRTLLSISSGTSMMKFNKTQLKNTLVPVAPLTVQRHIVELLEKTQRIIDLRKKQLEHFDTLIKARFVEMFGDLRNNPNNWPIYHFDEITDIITDGEHVTPRRVDKGFYLLSARNVLNHMLQLDDIDFIDQEEYDRIAKRIVPKAGDVLISCSGSVGRCCVVPEGLKFQMVRSVALLRFDQRVLPAYAEYMIASDDLQDQINSAKTASSQANLFQGKIAKLRGFVPPIKLQKQFAVFVSQVEKSKVAVQKALDKAQLLFDSLIQQYFG